MLYLDEYKINIYSTNKGAFVFKAIDLAKRIQLFKSKLSLLFLEHHQKKNKKNLEAQKIFFPLQWRWQKCTRSVAGEEGKKRKKKEDSEPWAHFLLCAALQG